MLLSLAFYYISNVFIVTETVCLITVARNALVVCPRFRVFLFDSMKIDSECFYHLWCVAVIDHLDTLKKENAGAREAIRWLETEFQKGNRCERKKVCF